MSSMKNLIGQTLGQYEIIEQIGEGGMATVFKARQPSLNREVALKILSPLVAEKTGFAERFIREAQAIGNLSHPNILPVFDSGQDKGYGFLAMRYVPKAETLGDVMRRGSLTTNQIIRLAEQIGGALDHAHRAGIVHRDVKPSNILMDNDWAYLSDFGLAKVIEVPSELTGSGVGIGTPAYMSPEQAKGEKIDHRTDIFALGIILFEMLTGQVPHKAETPIATMMKRLTDPLPAPRSLNPEIPAGVEKVLVKALALNPDDRFERAGELVAALKSAFAEKPGEAPKAAAGLTGSPASPPVFVAQTGPAATLSSGPTTLDIVIMTLLGVVTLCGVSGSLLAFTTDAQGQSNIALLPMCLGLMFAAGSSMGLVWFRRRNIPASAWLAIGILAWFVGVSILGFGGFAAFNPDSDQTFIENLGFSVALCIAPGGLLALVGLGLYAYDYRRGKAAEALSDSQVNVAGSQAGGAAAAAVRHIPPPAKVRHSQADKLRRAAEYRTGITNIINQQSGLLADQLKPIVAELDSWQAHLQSLADRLHNFENDQVIQRDLIEVPAAIVDLEQRIEAEINPSLQIEMTETLNGYQKHQRQLDNLVTTMRRTELDIDETLAAIGSIYSQIQLLSAKKIDSAKVKNLSANIHEQNDHLDDLLEAMDEVYQSTMSLRLG